MTDMRSGKPSWEELDAMYTRAVALTATMRSELDAANRQIEQWQYEANGLSQAITSYQSREAALQAEIEEQRIDKIEMARIATQLESQLYSARQEIETLKQEQGK